MRGEVIALDLETTGLDPTTDKIIEIGIIRCLDDDILDEFSTLIDPGKPIPSKITSITGITQQDIEGQPRIERLLPSIRNFVGDYPVIAHNIDFDLGMLARHDIGQTNVAIDTYELAAVLLPTAPRYNLNSLVQGFDLELENAHRALEDAVAAWQVYRHLWNKLLDMPINILREIVDHAVALEWKAKPAFVDALQLRTGSGETLSARSDFSRVFYPDHQEGDRLRPNANYKPIDEEEVASKILPGGPLASKMPGYELRESQVDMLRQITEALNRGDHCMIEAPTGTGKSLAYLLPSAIWGITNNERVVVSTHTINLQDQLLQKDIPLLREQLGIPFSAANLKGRGNYLCPRRLFTLRRRKPTNVDELRVLAKILVWLGEDGDGVLTNLNLRGGAERQMWYRLTAQDEGCTLDRCRRQMKGTCPFFKARAAAERAHILIVNHSLLLADVAVGNRVIPDYRYVILDEGHHLEDAITDGLTVRIDKYGLVRKLADLGTENKGLLGDLLGSLQDIPSDYYEKLRDFVTLVVDALRLMDDQVRAFFDGMAGVLLRGNQASSDYLTQIRVTDKVRNRPEWIEVHNHWDVLKDYTGAVGDSMIKLAKALADLSRFEDQVEDYENLLSSVQAAATYMETTHLIFKQFVEAPQENTIYWVEIGYDGRQVALNAAPLHVGDLVQQHLWEAKESVILTSATLRTANSFEYMAERLGAEMVNQVVLESPFDYEQSTMVYVPTDIPEPNQRKEYQSMVERGIIELASVTQGRMLCLFTSYQQLRETVQAVAPRLALGGITVYDQSSGSSRQVLLDSFKSTDKAVLMGTRSFWEGIDVPGDDLVAVVIVRLPFSVPTDPVFSARSEVYAERSFMEYSVPDAILRFRQGFGRLIRRKDDRGLVVIMDRRVISKRYGQLFLESLPKATYRQQPLDQLPREADRWLNGNSRG